MPVFHTKTIESILEPVAQQVCANLSIVLTCSDAIFYFSPFSSIFAIEVAIASQY